MYEPEEFLETLDHMIELTVGILTDDAEGELPEGTKLEIAEDLKRLRDLHQRIRLQFNIEAVTWN